MKNFSRLKGEDLVEYASRLAIAYNNQNSKLSKKTKGQFFTSSDIAKFMAEMSTKSQESISILDPGSGIGILSIALIEKLTKNEKVKEIKLVCYETDKKVLPYLKQLLEETQRSINKKVSFEYTIFERDFVKENANSLTINLSNYNKSNQGEFDIIIANPPYFKINKKDLQLPKFREIISGQPNMYFLFMAISAKLLNDNGEMIFITPRSFCSGLYYSKFRKWLVSNVNFEKLHIFESRKELFASENVLQENIITKFTKRNVNKIEISKTYNGNFSDRTRIKVCMSDVIYKSNGHIFFRIPSSEEELRVIRKLDRLPNNFYKLGIKISTGKVVAFRNKDYLVKELKNDSVPLIWMHNIRNGKIEWPLVKKEKAIAIQKNDSTKHMLLEADNYLALKRFTTKEQKKRFVTGCIFKDDFEKYGCFALDNMVNYIHSPEHSLSKNQIKGIAKYLDLPIVDLYFRILNGHTQVNANEVYALPFPSLAQLESLGKKDRNNIRMPKIQTDNIESQACSKTNNELIYV